MATKPVCERMHPPILRSCPYDAPPAECPWPWGPQQMHKTTLNSAGGRGDGESQGFRSVFGAKKKWEGSAQDDAVPHNPHDGLIMSYLGNNWPTVTRRVHDVNLLYPGLPPLDLGLM